MISLIFYDSYKFFIFIHDFKYLFRNFKNKGNVTNLGYIFLTLRIFRVTEITVRLYIASNFSSKTVLSKSKENSEKYWNVFRKISEFIKHEKEQILLNIRVDVPFVATVPFVASLSINYKY